MSKTSESAERTAPKINKSEWIRNQAASISAKDVVAKAKAEGIALSVAQVYSARKKSKSKPIPAPSTGKPAVEDQDELMFRRLVLRIGMSAAAKYLLLLKQSVGL